MVRSAIAMPAPAVAGLASPRLFTPAVFFAWIVSAAAVRELAPLTLVVAELLTTDPATAASTLVSACAANPVAVIVAATTDSARSVVSPVVEMDEPTTATDAVDDPLSA